MRRIMNFAQILLLVVCTVLASGPAFAADGDGPVSFQFVDVEIPVVIQFISEVTGKNFIFDERVRGKVTILAPEPITADQAFALFTSILDLKGFTVVPAGAGGFKIVPSAEAKQSGTRILTGEGGGMVNESHVARIFSLQHITSKDAFVFLQPLVAKNGHISSFPAGNLLLVVDATPNIEKIDRMIGLIDHAAAPPATTRILLEHADAQEVSDIVTRALGGRPAQPARRGKKAAAPVEESGVEILADIRLNAVLLVGGSPETLAAAHQLIRLLDQPVEQARAGIHVIDLQYADASDLAEVLNKLFASQTTVVQRKTKQPNSPTAVRAEFDGPVRITPAPVTNSLVIMASPADFRNLESVVHRLDRRRRQVLVEALFMEVKVGKLEDLGTKWRAAARHDGEPIAVGGFGQLDSSTFTSILQGLGGVSLGGLGDFFDFTVTDPEGNQVTLTTPGFAFLFSLQEFKDVVDVLSAPHILTSDNQEAELIVGENVPFVSKRESNTTATPTDSFFNVIERTDVGIKLRITPQITEGDTVTIDIYQEISALVGGQSDEILTEVGPTTTKRSAETSITVQDGSTVVIGGLMQERAEVLEQRVPLLSDIPGLGWLFRFKSTSKEKTNLVIFLTPHIVRDDIYLSQVSADKETEFRQDSDRFIPGEILLVFGASVGTARQDQILAERGATVIQERDDGLVVALPEGQGVLEALQDFARLPEVVTARPNFRPRVRAFSR